jgi:hypothetical protein
VAVAAHREQQAPLYMQPCTVAAAAASVAPLAGADKLTALQPQRAPVAAALAVVVVSIQSRQCSSGSGSSTLQRVAVHTRH